MFEFMKNIFTKDKKTLIFYAGIIIAVFLIGMYAGSGSESGLKKGPISDETKSTMWTCSMHPQIQQPNPGQCPICGMDLIPVSRNETDAVGSRQIKLSESAQKLANIQVSPVERKFVSKEIRMVGKIEFDETRLKYITSWVPGRIDRMFVDYTGTLVRKNDHLVELYSPELLSTQQELAQTYKSFQTSGSHLMRQNLDAIRERLRLWGVSSDQIKTIEETGKISDRITIYSPINGVVVHKDGLQGMYVQTGTRIYTIADLSKLWLKMDAYESNIPWLRYGQKVEFETEAYAGEKFEGRITFIDPVLNEKTRTVKVRIIVDNTAGKLKPGMFVNAVVQSQIAAGGKVLDKELAGKWISPMHPEIVKDKPGKCDVCGMDLVRSEELGFVSTEKMDTEASLVIPSTAPLITGKRAVVYVQVPGKDGVFEGREVVLGPRAGDYYLVKEGLKEGEFVVTNGNFKIDSAIQILAKPSMMNPEGRAISTGHQHGEMSAILKPKSKQSHEMKGVGRFEKISKKFLFQLSNVYNAYFDLQFALSHDNLKNATSSAKEILNSLKIVNMTLVQGDAHNAWMKRFEQIKASSEQLVKSENIEGARKTFESLSQGITLTVKQFGSDDTQSIYLYHCPMAFDNKGANWLQNKEGTENPYFGSKMFKCGTQEEVLVKK